MTITLGCYGSAICNDDKSEVCKQCSLAVACFELAKENTEKIKARWEVDVSKIERRQHQRDVINGKVTHTAIVVSGKREALSDYQKAIVNHPDYPIKARQLVGSLFRKGITGIYLRQLLHANINPFINSKPAILDVACRLILVNKLSKNNLRTAYQHLGHSDKTALAQACVVITSFMLLGVLTKDLKLRDK